MTYSLYVIYRSSSPKHTFSSQGSFNYSIIKMHLCTFITFPSSPSLPSPIPPNPPRHLLRLPPHNIHRLIRAIQIVPTRTLMRRVARPHHAELIHMLRLRTPDAAVGPRRGADVGAVCLEEGDGGGYNGLEGRASAEDIIKSGHGDEDRIRERGLRHTSK